MAEFELDFTINSARMAVQGTDVAAPSAGDIKVYPMANGMFVRDSAGIIYGPIQYSSIKGVTPDIHFASASIPSGYAWTLDGTPPTVDYDYLSDYLLAISASTDKSFLSKAIPNVAGNWQNKALYGRFSTGLTTEIGLRIDNGTDNNFAEIYVSGVLANGTQRVDFRHKTGGGVTTLNSAVIIPCSDFITLALKSEHSGGVYTIKGYIVPETGVPVSIPTFTVTSTSFSPSAGRAGIIVAEAGSNAYCDWFTNEMD
jgi:hypothetical protein